MKALRNRDVRVVHCPKNTSFARALLEDGLLACLPASAPLLREALKDADAEVRQSAALVLLRADRDVKAALPVLTEDLWGGKGHDERARFRHHALERLGRRRSPESTEAIAAAWCEGWRVASPEAREAVERWLVVFQPEALPHLLAQLRRAKGAERRELAVLLSRFEGQGKAVVPILRDEVREREPKRHLPAAQALGRLGPDAAEAVPELTKLLDSEHVAVKIVAAQTLGAIGPAAKAALPRLKAMLKGDWRVEAAAAIGRIDPGDREALAALRDELVRTKSPSRLRSSVSMPDDVEAEVVFPEFLLDALARFGARAAPALAAVLDDADLDEWSADNASTQCGSPARVQAALLLARIGPGARAAVPALTRALGDRDPFVREAAASALGRVGSAARPRADLLRLFLRRSDWGERKRVAAALALDRVAGERDAAFAVLREVLMGAEEHGGLYHFVDESDTARVRAAKALAVLAEKGDAAAKALLAELAKGDENPHVRDAARRR